MVCSSNASAWMASVKPHAHGTTVLKQRKGQVGGLRSRRGISSRMQLRDPCFRLWFPRPLWILMRWMYLLWAPGSLSSLHSDNLHLFGGAFSPFILNVMINIFGIKSTPCFLLVLSVLWVCLVFFLFCFFFLLLDLLFFLPLNVSLY